MLGLVQILSKRASEIGQWRSLGEGGGIIGRRGQGGAGEALRRSGEAGTAKRRVTLRQYQQEHRFLQRTVSFHAVLSQ